MTTRFPHSLLVLLMALGTDLHAQGEQEALERLQCFTDRLMNAHSYHVRTEVRIYGPASSLPIFKEQAEAYAQEGAFWSRIGGRVTMSTPGEHVIVDHQEKLVIHHVYDPGCTYAFPMAPADSRQQILDALTTNGHPPTVVRCDADRITIGITGQDNGYSSTEITLSTRDNALERITYCLEGEGSELGHGRSMQRIELVYTLFDLNAAPPPKRPRMGDYLRPSGPGEWQLTPAYAGYELIRNERS